MDTDGTFHPTVPIYLNLTLPNRRITLVLYVTERGDIGWSWPEQNMLTQYLEINQVLTTNDHPLQN